MKMGETETHTKQHIKAVLVVSPAAGLEPDFE
jgi:hypothetical protein